MERRWDKGIQGDDRGVSAETNRNRSKAAAGTSVPADFRTGAASTWPLTAVRGDTPEALFAGAREARNTVKIPIRIPARILGALMAKPQSARDSGHGSRLSAINL